MPNLISAKRCQKRKIAPADQLKAVDDIDMPFTMSALETIINFGQILEIKTVTLIGTSPHLDMTKTPPKPQDWPHATARQKHYWSRRHNKIKKGSSVVEEGL
jgi:hypothetical protein